ncbi:AAA family ATPase [Brevundimonas sp.]|uniref:AAA family ATPase n=1 Tax=Brevundimonas sp. TaxID=1871086 RepID=UPI0028AC6A3C|nr:AAA family ATPase [Brevundimonas sp.]
MISKIVIRNVGVLRAFDTPNAPKLDQLTLFYGRNGRGKSTLTTVLRAARDGEPTSVLARQSLGNGGAAPKVVLTSTAGNIVFDNGKWNNKSAPIEVFDTAFITDNVYAGEVIDLAHDRGLFSVIIGTDGVALAKHLERFNAIAKDCAGALKSAEAALSDDVPIDLNREEFLGLSSSAQYDDRLDAAERALKAVQNADKIALLKPLEVISVSALPAHLDAVLASTVTDIDASARKRLLDHFKRFALDKRGEAWITYGVDHVHDDACPFCGRAEVDSQGMVTLYGQIFGEVYKAHLATITTTTSDLEDAIGEDARTKLAAKIATNAETLSKWADYVSLGQDLPDVSNVGGLIAEAHRNIRAVLDRKRSSPLDVIVDADEVSAATEALADTAEILTRYNEAVAAINATTGKALSTTTINEAAAVLARDNVKKRMARHDPGVQKRVDAYYRAKRRDQRAKDTRTKIQTRLKQANKDAAEHYHQKVNHYLGRFGASFSISEITNSMQGNAGQADYGLLIKGEKIARGRGRQVDANPTFRNTLSAGDKTTLALAFFLAKLDHDATLGCKTLVIDDPLSSHDSHRRRETVNAIKDLCRRCLQVIVLSHDEFLLRDVQQRCVGVPSAAFQIEFSGGDEWSAASAVDLDQICRAQHAKLVDEITAFVDARQGDPDHVVHNVRRVLETHYRRSYSAYFARDRNLGQIVKDIAAAGSAHPCHRDLSRIDNCNDFTCDRHHGDDAIVVVKQAVDPDDLRTIARDALELIGARKPFI